MISIIIPAHNEEANIGQTVADLKKVLDGVKSNGYEIVVVDDHSSDGTFRVVQSLKVGNVHSVRLSRQCGSHTAIRAGLSQAKGDCVLVMAADGQDDTKVLPEMLAKWDEGKKIIWALRRSRAGEAWYIRKPAILFYKALSWLGGTKYTNIDFSRADFFLLDKKVVDAINTCHEKNTSLFGLIAWLGFSSDFVEYNRKERVKGKTKWSLKNRVHLAKDWIVAFSGLPLKLMAILGVFIALLGFLYGFYIFINAIIGSPSPGWSSIMVAIFVLCGTQMIMLGILGEYLWRNLDESRKRPLYFIEDTTEET